MKVALVLAVLAVALFAVYGQEETCVCGGVISPVCGLKDGINQWYTNSCLRTCDGAEAVADSLCDAGTKPGQHLG